jgi:hypothetical protein
VQLRSNRSGAFAALMLAAALSGCANADVFDSNERWFSRPVDWTGRNGGYTFSELQETNEKKRSATASDLVDANGACPPAPAPAAPLPNTAEAAGAAMPAAPGAPSLLGEGIALGMSECDVVYRAGTPGSVQLSTNPNGDRIAVLTYNSGPRPGIYRFERGRLADMDRVEAPPEEKPKIAKRAVKKKKEPAKPEQVSTE